MSKNKNQHIVQRAYLNGFSSVENFNGVDCRVIYYYDRITNKIVKTSPDKATTMPHYYSYPNDDGTYNDEVDKAFNPVEDKMAHLLRDLQPYIQQTLNGRPPITTTISDQKTILADYIAMLNGRSPACLEYMSKEIKQIVTEKSERIDEGTLKERVLKGAQELWKKTEVYNTIMNSSMHFLCAKKVGL